MRNLVLMMIVSLILSMLLFFCHRDDISRVQRQHQTYHHHNLLR